MAFAFPGARFLPLMLNETTTDAVTGSGYNQAYSAWLYCQASAAGCEPERVHSTIGGLSIWKPQPGPQTEAYNSEAEIIGYGGAAGGGKSFLALGLAATKHHRSIIFRRVFPSLGGLIDDSQKILTRKGDNYNGSAHIWKTADNRVIQFGQVQYKTDQKKHQGQPRDLMVFDECTEFPESVVRFLMGWNRTTVPGQRCRVVLTFNPPMDDVGDWVTQFFGPWLDEASPNPAEDGELRWYARVEDRDFPIKEDELRWFIADGDSLVEVADDAPIKQGRHLMTPMRGVWVNGVAYLAKSRTFFHASLKDNPILAATGYGATVDALPEPLRSLLKGQFHAGRIADPWQVIPSDWIKMANERWKQREAESGIGGLPGKLRCDTLGVDVARGGRDATVIARRYGNWFAQLIKVPGTATPNGPSVAALVMNYLDKPANKHDAGPTVHIDAIGVGTSPFDILEASSVNVIPVVASEGSKGFDKSGKLKFRNLRAEMYWRLRESLDPTNGDGLALPPDPELLADLCAPRWSLSTAGILIESKKDIFERIGRSPDCGDAVVMANWSGIPKPIAAAPPVMMSRSSWNGSGDYEDEE